jgi:hypothetical protein
VWVDVVSFGGSSGWSGGSRVGHVPGGWVYPHVASTAAHARTELGQGLVVRPLRRLEQHLELVRGVPTDLPVLWLGDWRVVRE